jgi:diadenosine tetraphosphate (Ap4A) HIT family hydrolase
MLKFLQDSQKAVKAIREATGCARVNVASLGNSVSHIHLHLIPRFPSEEAVPHGAPWRDPRPQTELPETEAKELMHKIASLL